MRWSWDGSEAEFTLDVRDLGSPPGFSFWTVASWEGGYDTYYDWGPDIGQEAWNYQVRAADGEPPETWVHGGPASETSERTAMFFLTASEDGSAFECSLDGAVFAACGQAVSYTGLAEGVHTFRARAVDKAGNTDPTPASHTWTVLPSTPAPGSGRWADPAGDQEPGAPDITAVTVSDDGVGTLTIRVDTPNFESLAEGTWLEVAFDTDQNPETGKTSGGSSGAEYLVILKGDRQAASLGWWDGEGWQWLDSSVGFGWRFGATITLDVREIGSPRGFNFYALAAWDDGSDDWPLDSAPDGIGTWNYQVGTAAQPPAPPDPDPEPEPPSADLFLRPTAGGEWAYTAAAASHTGERVVVHYVTAGRDAPPAGDADSDGVPDYVEEIAEAADAALTEFELLGFKVPLRDNGGPDGRPDLYVKQLKRGTLGLAVPHRYADGGAFLLVHPGLDTATDVLQDVSLRATVAHEVFHLVQFSYFPGGGMPRWVAEGTASAAEAIAYPDLDETNWFLRVGGWLDEPWRPVYDEEFHCERCYGGAL